MAQIINAIAHPAKNNGIPTIKDHSVFEKSRIAEEAPEIESTIDLIAEGAFSAALNNTGAFSTTLSSTCDGKLALNPSVIP